MTADTLSAETLAELVARLRSLSGSLKLTPDESDACHDAADMLADQARAYAASVAEVKHE